MENFADSQSPCEEFTINRLDPDTLKILSSTTFASCGEEIYDLLPIDDLGSWPLEVTQCPSLTRIILPFDLGC